MEVVWDAWEQIDWDMAEVQAGCGVAIVRAKVAVQVAVAFVGLLPLALRLLAERFVARLPMALLLDLLG